MFNTTSKTQRTEGASTPPAIPAANVIAPPAVQANAGDAYEMHPVQPQAAKPVPPGELPAPAVAPRRGRVCGGWTLKGIFISSAVVAIGVAVGVGVGVGVRKQAGASTRASDAPLPPKNNTDAMGVLGGPSGTALANANLRAIPLAGCANNHYFANFTIGDQEFRLAVDTGSTITAVAGEGCGECVADGVSPLYRHGASAVNTGNSSSLYYLGGTDGWNGTVYRDTITGRAGDGNATTPVIMNFVAMSHEAEFFGTWPCAVTGNPTGPVLQGILGIGVQMNEENTDDFVSKLSLVSGLPNAFTFQACDSANGFDSGFLTFGGYNPNVVANAPQFVNMLDFVTEHSFCVNTSALRLGNATLSQHIGPTLLDTGTTGLIVSLSLYNELIQDLTHNAAFVRHFNETIPSTNSLLGGNCVPTNLTRAEVDAQLPELSMDIEIGNGSVMAMTFPASKSYMLPLAANASSLKAAEYCFVAVASDQVPMTMGANMMHDKALVFDIGNRRLGFAPALNCPQTFV